MINKNSNSKEKMYQRIIFNKTKNILKDYSIENPYFNYKIGDVVFWDNKKFLIEDFDGDIYGKRNISFADINGFNKFSYSEDLVIIKMLENFDKNSYLLNNIVLLCSILSDAKVDFIQVCEDSHGLIMLRDFDEYENYCYGSESISFIKDLFVCNEENDSNSLVLERLDKLFTQQSKVEHSINPVLRKAVNLFNNSTTPQNRIFYNWVSLFNCVNEDISNLGFEETKEIYGKEIFDKIITKAASIKYDLAIPALDKRINNAQEKKHFQIQHIIANKKEKIER